MTNNLSIKDSDLAVKIVKTTETSTVHTPHHNVDSQPARIRTTDTMSVALATDAIMNGTTALTPKFVKISAGSSGNNTIVAAVTSKKIRVLSYTLIGSGVVNPKFQDGASGTDLTGLLYIAGLGGGCSAAYSQVGHFETTAGTLLNLNLSGAVIVGGHLTYIEV